MPLQDGRDRLILVGRLGAAHGVRGEIRLLSFTQDRAAILSYAPLFDRAGTRAFSLRASRPLKDGAFIVRLDGVDSREAAQALTNLDLYVSREKLPATQEEEFYVADLVGLLAQDPEGRPIGHVRDVLDYGAGQILEVAPEAGGETLLFPFTRAVAPGVDLAAGVIVIAAPVEIEAREEAGGDAADAP